jgi:hypothetical protein
MSWICHTCGEKHDDIPLSFAADYPDNYANLSPEAKQERTIIGSDQCVIDEADFYIRGCLEIPIQNSEEIFLWGVWASLWKEDYLEIADCWEEEGRENTHGPFKGRLGNSLKEYPQGTANLKLTVKLRPVGERPLFFIDEPAHALAIAQSRGMTREQVNELVSSLMH